MRIVIDVFNQGASNLIAVKNQSMPHGIKVLVSSKVYNNVSGEYSYDFTILIFGIKKVSLSIVAVLQNAFPFEITESSTAKPIYIIVPTNTTGIRFFSNKK